MRTPSGKTTFITSLKPRITATTKLWCKYHLTSDHARYVGKEGRRALGGKRIKVRQRVIQRPSREEEQRLIHRAYRHRGERGLLIKTLL